MKTQALCPFGQKLKYWRRLRGVSQLDLAVDADVSTRHISFIETGRSRPGRQLVLRLAEALDVPPRECNELLEAAGLAAGFREGGLSEERLAPYRRIVDRILRSHEPYPAFVLDRWWNIVDSNAPTQMFFPQLAAGGNLVEVFLANEPPHLINRIEVGINLLARVRQDWARSGHDARIEELMKRLEQELASAMPTAKLDGVSPVIAAQIDVAGTIISTVGTIMHFDTAREITLDELRIEMFFPADDASEAFFIQFAQ